jgi:hypothetical protein
VVLCYERESSLWKSRKTNPRDAHSGAGSRVTCARLYCSERHSMTHTTTKAVRDKGVFFEVVIFSSSVVLSLRKKI